MVKSFSPASPILSGLPDILPGLEATYKDVHAHPELSMQEHRTAGIAEKHLRDHGYDVTGGVGQTGVVGPAGTVAGTADPISSAADSFQIHPTLETGVEAMVVGAQAWLGR